MLLCRICQKNCKYQFVLTNIISSTSIGFWKFCENISYKKKFMEKSTLPSETRYILENNLPEYK